MSTPDTKLITGTIAPDTKLTAQTNPESVSLDSSMTFHTANREVLRITNEARLVIGEGLSKEEATQEVAKLLVAAFKERIQQMLALASDVQDEIATLQDLYASAKARAEKAEDETLVWRNRFASILWSGALGKSTVRDFKKWEAEYKAEQNALTARAEKAEADTKRLDWIASRKSTELVYFAAAGWSIIKSNGGDLLCDQNIHNFRDAIDAAMKEAQNESI